MTATAELRSIYSGPIRRALDGLNQRVSALENATLVVSRAYQWKTATDATDPLAGFIKANAAPASATVLYASIYGQQGVVVDWASVEKGFDLRIYLSSDASRMVQYTVAAPPVSQGGWFTIPVTFVAIQTFAPGNNTDVVVRISGAVGGGGVPPGGSVAKPAYAGPWRTSLTATDNTIASYSHTGVLKEGMQVDASGYVRFYAKAGTPTGSTQIQFIELAADHITETWIASLNRNRFALGDLTLGAHPTLTRWGAWLNSRPGDGDYLWLRDHNNGDLLLNAVGGAVVYLRQGNANLASFNQGYAYISSYRTIIQGNDEGNIDWSHAHIRVEAMNGDWYPRIAFYTPGMAPQLRANHYLGDQLECVASGATVNCPIIASAFTVSSSTKAKRDVRDLHPQRERIVVHHDVRSDLVPEPDIMALRPVAYRPIEPHMTITDDHESVPRDPDTWLGHEGVRERLGLIAEDVATVIPSAVSHGDDGRTVGIDYAQITVALLDHVQRLTDEVATLRYRISELEAS